MPQPMTINELLDLDTVQAKADAYDALHRWVWDYLVAQAGRADLPPLTYHRTD